MATWHQGGPGGSSIYGLFGEMGYFQLEQTPSGNVTTFTNKFAWNQVANMLYLESPAGSGDPIGFSYCTKGGKPAAVCSWDDRSQAEAYAHTLQAFYKAFPEFASNDLYLTGESYAGQYLPNIATFLVANPSFAPNLKGIAVGNGCWGGDKDTVTCNGPNAEQNTVDLFYGKGLLSKKLYTQIYDACDYKGGISGVSGSGKAHPLSCAGLLLEMGGAVGPHNVYARRDDSAAAGGTLCRLKAHRAAQPWP